MGVKRNSLKAGITVYKYYLEKYNSKRIALLKYKGVINNKKTAGIVDKVLRLEKEYRERVNNIFRKKGELMELRTFNYQVRQLLDKYDEGLQEEMQDRINKTLNILGMEVMSIEAVALIIATVLADKKWKDKDGKFRYST